MEARQRDGHINARSQDKIRAAIKAGEIVDCLNRHILGELKMTNTQVRAAEVLLRKVQPDLIATHISMDEGQGVPLLKIVREAQPEALEHEGPLLVGDEATAALNGAPVDGADTQVRHAPASSSKVSPD